MRKSRKALIGVVATAVLVAPVFAMPAGSAIGSAGGGDSPIASEAKKKCKKKKKKKCKKGGGGFYLAGRYSGTYAENNVDLFFNVLGGRVYTGPFDAFFINAICNDASTDPSAIEPVSANIGRDGSFFGSGVWVVGGGSAGGFSVPWTLSGRIAGGTISSGVFVVGPYTYPLSNGRTCSGTTHFTAAWFGNYVL